MVQDSILTRSQWSREGQYDVQVLPHAKTPGSFMGRIVVRGGADVPAAGDLIRQVRDCGDIRSLSVYMESPSATSEPVKLNVTEASSILPSDLIHALQLNSNQGTPDFYTIQPGTYPKEPIYPVWTRDTERSRMVIEGRYSEIIPLSFEFVPTLNCLFRCHDCAYKPPKEALGLWKENIFAPAYHMDADTMNILLDRLADAKVKEVLFTGGGEPLLNVATPQGMKHSTSLGFKTGLYTNGTLINERKARAIVEAQPDFVRISLNAGTREVYFQHHNPLKPEAGVDYFSRVQAGIRALAKAKQEQQSRMVFGISYLLDPMNAADAVNGATLLANLALENPGMINYMRFTPAINYFGPDQYPLQAFQASLDALETDALPLLRDAGVETSIYYHRFSGMNEPRPYQECLGASWYGGVGPGGILYWCCEKLFNNDFAFGSLLDNPLSDIWAGEARQQVADHVSLAVKGGTNSPCPVVCKPHEHNKVFWEVETLRREGKVDLLTTWLDQVHYIVATSQTNANARLWGFAAKEKK